MTFFVTRKRTCTGGLKLRTHLVNRGLLNRLYILRIAEARIKMPS